MNDMKKRQVIVIHGGDSFETYKRYIKFLKEWKIDFDEYRHPKKKWRDTLATSLGGNFEVITPRMPNNLNARYLEWKIWFDKFVPYLRPGVVLVGYSLGGVFLAKYLTEKKFPVSIAATFLIAAPFEDDGSDPDESLVDFKLPKKLDGFQKQGGKIFIYHSKDDPIVPYSHAGKYEKTLGTATKRVFANRGHFWQSDFPELVRDIKRAAS